MGGDGDPAGSTQVIDPFVGRGTTLAMAEQLRMALVSSVCIDNDRDQCEKARQLTVEQLESYLCK